MGFLELCSLEQEVIDKFDFKLQRIDADYSDKEECEKRHEYENRSKMVPFFKNFPLQEETKLWYIHEFIKKKLGFMGNNYLVNKGHVRALQIYGDMKEHKDQKFTKTVELPDNFGNLSELQTINITFTNLENIPSSIGKLKKLFLLNLEFNNIKSLPESIGTIPCS